MLHNNHIIKTLSNAFLSMVLVGFVFITNDICSMASIERPTEAKSDENSSPLPGPTKPPFGRPKGNK